MEPISKKTEQQHARLARVKKAAGNVKHRVPQSAKAILWRLGPGLITGAADDDPSGIATYSQVGAQFGFGMLWTMIFSFPLMAAVQQISARIGRVTGQGIAANMRQHYPRPLLLVMILMLVAANVFNLGADIGAMGAATTLLLPGPAGLYVALFGIVSVALQVFVPYSRYVTYLKWLTVSLFAYVLTALVLHQPSLTAIRATLFPSISLRGNYFTALIAILGTTISPYLFFWQASQEAENVKIHPDERPLKQDPAEAPAQLQRIKIDTYIGMLISNLVAFFIILTAAASLHAHGITDVQTADQAARVLEPIAGRFAFFLFAIGIQGTGLLAVPVLAGSAAYGVSETFKWKASLEKKANKAVRFYATIAVATLLGLLLNLLGQNPMRALFWSAVINGLVAGPVLICMLLLAQNRKVMGQFTLTPALRAVGWLTALVMLASAVGMIATLRH